MRNFDIFATQVVKGFGGQRVADDAEAGIGRVGSSILEGIPPDVGRGEEGAADLFPVSLGVLERRHGLADRLAAYGEPSLRDPDGLAANGSGSLCQSLVEKVIVLADVVCVLLFKVRIGILANPVASINDGLVGTIGPGGPSVNL